MKLHLPKMLAAALLAAFVSFTQASGTAITDAVLSLADFSQSSLDAATGWTFTNIAPSANNTYVSTGTKATISHDSDWVTFVDSGKGRLLWSAIVQLDIASLPTTGGGTILQQDGLSGVGFNGGKETGAWQGNAWTNLTLNDKTLAQCADGDGVVTLGFVNMGGSGATVYIVDGQKNVYSASADGLKFESTNCNPVIALTTTAGLEYESIYLFGDQVSADDMGAMMKDLVTTAEVKEYVWAGTGTSAVWDTTSSNWTVGGSATKYVSGNSTTAIFDTTGSAKNVQVNSSVEAAEVNVRDSYTFTVGSGASVVTATLNVDAGNTLTVAGTGTVKTDKLNNQGTIVVNAGARFAMQELKAANTEASIPVEGEGTLAIDAVTVSGANGRVSFGVPTDNGYVRLTGGVVNYGGGVVHELDQLGLSYDGAQASTVNVETDTTLHVVGTNVAYDNAHRMESSMFLGHWNAQNTINVDGTLIAEAALSGWDGKVAINVAEGGRLELRDGLNRNKSRTQAIDINVTNGGVVAAGTTHNTEHTVSHDSLSVNLSDGAIFQSYYAAGETTADLGGKLNFTDGTATLDVGGAELTTTISGTLAGTGSIKKTGKGTLVITGGNKALGGTISLTEGTLTFNSDVVLDLANMEYETTQEGDFVYTLVEIGTGATYTGWDSLGASSITGVMVDQATFKADGTLTLSTVKPHPVEWDPNWGVTGPDALSAELTATTALITSPYKDGSDVAVELTGSGNPDAYIYGGQDSEVNNTGTTYAANVWIDAKEGSYKAIVGGNYCNNWGDGGTLNFEGDTHIQIDGATVGTIIGGNYKDGKAPKFTGSSYISVVSGDVTASIVGASTNSHKEATTFTGDTHIFIYVPLATDSVNPLPDEGNYTAVPKNHVIGGISHMHNVVGTGTLDGSTNITIDLSKYEGGASTFVKTVVGGSQSDLEAHTQSITGDTNVTIKGGSIEFSGDIIAGNRNHNGSSTIGGGSTLSIENGTYSGTITGGSKITAGATSEIGAVEVTLGGAAQFNGNVYAAGVIDGAGTGGSTVASTTVNLGADVTIVGTLSGGFGGANADRGTVTDTKLLNLTDAKEYTSLSTATVDAFDEISVVKDGSATIATLSNTPWLTKGGEGALTLALGGDSAIMDVEVAAGTLTLGAADMEIMGITVDSGATLAAAAGSSLQAAGITLAGGSTLSVGTEGLVLADGSYLTMDSGKVNITTAGASGLEIVLVTGLTEDDSITGITFDKTDDSGNKYADSSIYLTLGTTLADYTQLKVKDGKLVLAKASGGGNYWGKGKGSGTWDLTTENWAKDDGLDASGKFTNNAAAYFTANGGGGAITVGEAVKVTTLNVSGAAYSFVNGDRITISAGINVSNSGSATLDKVAGTLQGITIADSGSSMTVTSGSVNVQDLSSEGSLTVAAGNLAIGKATAKGGNVKANNLSLATGESAFGTVQVSGTVTGATKLTVGGTSAIGSVEGIGTLALDNGTLALGNATGLSNTQLGGALTVSGEAVNLGNVVMADGSSISSANKVMANGITVTGTGTVKGGATLQASSVGGTGTLAVENGIVGIASGSTMTVSGTLDVKSGSHVANSGTLSVAGKVIAGNGVNLGSVAATGTVEVNGASVSATGGSIAALDMGSGESLTVASDLALTSTTGGNGGTLTVGGSLTAGGAVTVANLTAGTLELTTAGTLTATGTLDTASITLNRVSKTDHYLTAGSLSAAATDFVVDKAMVEALGASVGSIITLADLDSQYTGAVTINGGRSFSDKARHVYTIMQDSTTHDIVLTVDAQESGFVWTGREDTLWSTAGNWSGGAVPGSEDWVQVKNDANSHDIELDGDAEVSYFSVSATDAILHGEHTLEVGSALEVNVNGMLYVGDGESATTVAAPTATINGTLVVQPGSSVQADATTITGGTLNVNDATYTAETIDMAEGAALRSSEGATVATGQLNGDTASIVGGRVAITGNGGRYAGGYDSAVIDVSEDADATLYANAGLTLTGTGTVKLQYTAPRAVMDGVQADGLEIILNDPASGIGASTLAFQQPSRLVNGCIVFGLSAKDSALTLDSLGVPNVIEADSFYLDDTTKVVINQDRAGDTGIAMAVNHGGRTRNLTLARLGAEDTNTQDVTLYGYLYEKYYQNARIAGGVLKVDLRDDFYRTVSGAHSENGLAGAGMLDAALVKLNPQITNPTGDLAAVMTALEAEAYSADEADHVLSAMSGASIAAMGAAFGSDVDRQLRAIRNRTTSMGVAECEVSEDLPYVNAWINAEFDHRSLDNNGTYAGYKLSSWGGTVGFDVDCTPRFTFGLALTAMQGDFSASSADSAQGDLNRQYVSAFARYAHRAWTHTLVGTFGLADAKLDRTVNYGAGSYRTDDSTHGTAFGVMYELGYAMALDEEAASCIQPLLNLSFRHSALDGFKEKSASDAALTADDVEANVFTAALGARIQGAAGASVYNRASLFEGRVLFKMDAGDREVSAANSFTGVRRGMNAKATEMGAFGLELGGGVTIPLGESAGSLFFDVTGEFRSHYSEINGTAGYRINF